MLPELDERKPVAKATAPVAATATAEPDGGRAATERGLPSGGRIKIKGSRPFREAAPSPAARPTASRVEQLQFRSHHLLGRA